MNKHTTRHEVVFKNSRRMEKVADESIHLIVTSPPYPMIEMWDAVFSELNPKIGKMLGGGDGVGAFELMHRELDETWAESYRILCEGGILCINIGNAVRTIRGTFQMFDSHSRILQECLRLGFQALPEIIWRKQTNAPNKFMGSGMLPPGAYVTLEHEFVIILRKGDKRVFSEKEKLNRRESAFFWEERNNWFSDVWFDLKGTSQNLIEKDVRNRSAAFPFELPYRLINMFSVRGDTVLDPFLGTGVTTIAAIASERNSIGYELDSRMEPVIDFLIRHSVPELNLRISDRPAAHISFINARIKAGKTAAKRSAYYGFPCVSEQEKYFLVRNVKDIKKTGTNEYEAIYDEKLQKEYCEADKVEK